MAVEDVAKGVGRKVTGGRAGPITGFLLGAFVLVVVGMFIYFMMKPRVERWAGKANDKIDEAKATYLPQGKGSPAARPAGNTVVVG